MLNIENVDVINTDEHVDDYVLHARYGFIKRLAV